MQTGESRTVQQRRPEAAPTAGAHLAGSRQPGAPWVGQSLSTEHDLVDEALVEHIWQEWQGKASRTEIYQIVKETVDEFSHATVTTYIPIFVRRRVREKLALVLGN